MILQVRRTRHGIGLVGHGKMYKSLERTIKELHIKEDGHDDVASMKNKVEIGCKAFQKMKAALDKMPDEGSIPTWWTNKVATAVARIDDMSDYIDTQIDGEKDEE